MTISSSSVGAGAAPRTQAPHAPNNPSNKVEGSHQIDHVDGQNNLDHVDGKNNLPLAPKPHVGKDGAAAAGNQGLSTMGLPGQEPDAPPDQEYAADCDALDAMMQGCEQNVFDTDEVTYR
jgi:hypothetical protein